MQDPGRSLESDTIGVKGLEGLSVDLHTTGPNVYWWISTGRHS